MRNKLLRMIRQYDMIMPGDTVVCAVSGGADSVALLVAKYQLRDRLDIRLEAAHFNHHLRGEESDGDEAFVREFCDAMISHYTSVQRRFAPEKRGWKLPHGTPGMPFFGA